MLQMRISTSPFYLWNFIRETKRDEGKQDPNHTTMLALNKEDGVLLQAATAVVFNRENSKSERSFR